ncbi:MAG TPA: hypothetical protein VHF05_01725 [Candidatus Paceibacterota bacterium]|nr:hypothetical protein [Candidatus Paceibacterota bacterium]
MSSKTERLIEEYQALPNSEDRYELVHNRISDIKSPADALALCRTIGFRESFPDENTKQIQLEVAKKALEIGFNDRKTLIELHKMVYDPSTAELRKAVLIPLDKQLIKLTDFKNPVQLRSFCDAWKVELTFTKVTDAIQFNARQTLFQYLVEVCNQ